MTINTQTTETSAKMNTRRFFTEIQTYDLPAELLDFAASELEKMDKANEKRKSKPSKTQLENAEIKERIRAYLSDNFAEDTAFTRDEIGEAIGISPNKASALARQLVADGDAEQTEVKVGSKTYKAYRAIME